MEELRCFRCFGGAESVAGTGVDGAAVVLIGDGVVDGLVFSGVGTVVGFGVGEVAGTGWLGNKPVNTTSALNSS